MEKWVGVVLLALGLGVGCHSDTDGARECVKKEDCKTDERCVANRCEPCDDVDNDGYGCDDCDDKNPVVHPGAAEVCDGLDNDCDGEVDNGAKTTFYADGDHDGHGLNASSVEACVAPAGFVPLGDDCNDTDPTVNPARTEICDYKDNDCDGVIDNGATTTYYRDADGDGYGDPNNTVEGCIQPGGFVAVGGDCDDSRPDVHPGAEEQCNARDDNCDSIVDGNTRPCDSACGPGTETCTAGLFGGCTAPPILVINTGTTWTGAATVEAECIQVKAKLQIAADTVVNATNWIRVEQGGSIDALPRVTLHAGGSIALTGNGTISGSELVLDTDALSIDETARVFMSGAASVFYSAGGAAACTNGGATGSSGGAGGARGGAGGEGGTCGALSTQPTIGAGGDAAANGAGGCDCPCSSTSVGGEPSGGDGGAALAGGGGGGGGGAGGAGAAGLLASSAMSGGAAGDADGAVGVEPTTGGGGGGAAGTSITTLPSEGCRSAGGPSGGLLRVSAMTLVNKGLVSADGWGGADALGLSANAGGGGGGGGGSLVFHVASFDNRGSLSAVGGAGGAGAIAGGACSNQAGGGGGGGGGRVWVGGIGDGKPTVVKQGNLFLGGGAGGKGVCGASTGTKGTDGWVHIVE